MVRSTRLCVIPLIAACCITFVPADAAAQRDLFNPPIEPKRVDISGTIGLQLSTDWSDLVLLGSVSPATGAFEQVLARDMVVEPDTTFDGTVTYWEGRYGFRVHGAYSESCVTFGRGCGTQASTGLPAANSIDVKITTVDIGGAIGLLDYRPNRWVLPYVFLGLGAVVYDLNQSISPPLNLFIERRGTASVDELEIRTLDRSDVIAIDELGLETKFAFNFGVGTDFRIPLGPAGIGLRFEASDNIHPSPLNIRISDVNALSRGGGGGVDFGPVHNMRASVGVVLQFGR
jgi:opacity protein-like surface antigen